MMTNEHHQKELRDRMSALADLALSAEAKASFKTDPDEKAEVIHEYAAKIALAALALCPPERIADVSAIWKEAMTKPMPKPGTPDEHAVKPPMAMPLALPSGHDGVEEAGAVKPQYNPFVIGPFRIEHVSSKNVSIAKVRIGERVFSCETVDIAGACNVTIFDNGNSVGSMKSQRGKVTSSMIALKAMKEYIRQLSGNNHKGRRGFLPREIAKMEAADA